MIYFQGIHLDELSGIKRNPIQIPETLATSRVAAISGSWNKNVSETVTIDLLPIKSYKVIYLNLLNANKSSVVKAFFFFYINCDILFTYLYLKINVFTQIMVLYNRK